MQRVEFFLFFKRKNRALRLNLPVYTFYLFSFLGISLLFLLLFLIFSNYSRAKYLSGLSNLKFENSLLRSQLQQFSLKTESLSNKIRELVDFDTKLRIASGLEPIPKDLWNLGVGGKIPEDSAESNIDLLFQKVELQEVSYKEIEAHLKRQEHILDHTPSIWPVQGWIGSGFGFRKDPFTRRYTMHNGIDIIAPPMAPIVAPADGKVTFSGRRSEFGLSLIIDHGYGYETFFGHCSYLRVSRGDMVKRGQTIALVGRTGRTTGYHLHYGIKVAGIWVNPVDYIITDYALNY